MAPELLGCRLDHCQSPLLAIVKSAPEVRALCSAGITRPRNGTREGHSGGVIWPCPTPKGTVTQGDVEGATLVPFGPPQITRTTLPTVPGARTDPLLVVSDGAPGIMLETCFPRSARQRCLAPGGGARTGAQAPCRPVASPSRCGLRGPAHHTAGRRGRRPRLHLTRRGLLRASSLELRPGKASGKFIQQESDLTANHPSLPSCRKSSLTPSRARPPGLPRYHSSNVPCPLHMSVASPSRAAFPVSGGSASATSLSRPAQASLELRPVGSLNRPRRPLSQGFDPSGYPDKPPASYQIKPTTVWVDPSSTSDTRLLGALRSAG